jgi:hypothetical protein
MIYALDGDNYTIVSSSRYFPNFNLQKILAECLEIASDRSASVAMRVLRGRFPSASTDT